MKARIISAIIAFLIFIPIFIIGGITFNIAIYIVTLLGMREFVKAREKDKKYPLLIKLITYIMITIVYFYCTFNNNMTLAFNYKVIASIFLALFIPIASYHDEKIYNVEDAFYLTSGILFLGFAMSLFNMYRNMGLSTVVFLLLITIITDSYAYFVGMLIGRHKFVESISPKKTWEGTIGGSIMGTFICTSYYLTVINPNASIVLVSLIVFLLTLIGQFGDLFFSAIKRKYKIKDFSNIMPGHGGILDRLDSIIFVMLAFTLFLNIL